MKLHTREDYRRLVSDIVQPAKNSIPRPGSGSVWRDRRSLHHRLPGEGEKLGEKT